MVKLTTQHVPVMSSGAEEGGGGGGGGGRRCNAMTNRPLSAAEWRESGLSLQREIVLGFRHHVQNR
jgi:hypothetical protein